MINENYVLTIVNTDYVASEFKTEVFVGSESACKSFMDELELDARNDGYERTNSGYWFCVLSNRLYKSICFMEITPLRDVKTTMQNRRRNSL